MKSNKTGEFLKKHCMIVHAYYPLGETRVQREAEALLKHNHEVDVICLRKKNELAMDYFKGVRIFRLPLIRHRGSGLFVQFLEYLVFFFLVMVKVTWLYGQQRYQTIQVHNPPDFLVFTAWVPRLLGAKIILDMHDPMPEFYMGKFHRNFNYLLLCLVRFQESISCKFAHHVIVVGHHWRQMLVEKDVAPEKISIVMNIADETIFRPLNARSIQAKTNKGLHLIYHGAITYRYGLDLVLEAMAQLRRPDIFFTILGKGDYMEVLIRKVNKLKLNSQVTFYQELLQAEKLPEILLKSDVGIVPYRNDPYTDNLLPTKLMEYAALGLPTISARTTGISKYFDNDMVEFFTPGNIGDLVLSILKLYNNRLRLETLAQGIKRFNRNNNWTKISARYITLVNRLGTS